VQEARRRVAAGLLGRLLTVEARMITTQVRFRDPASWLFQRSAAGGGILTWLGCHYLDLIPHLLGDDITAVSAQLGTFSGEAIDVEDAASLTLRFKSGAIGTFHAGYLLAGRGTGYRNPAGFDNYLACNGRDGRIVWRGVTSRSLHIESTPAHSGLPTLQRLRYRLKKTDSYGGAVGEAFLRQFLAALRAEADLPATLGDALRAILVVEAAQRSAATQQTALVGS
jgi:predicted dehydrogenase